MNISATIITLNEEKNIARALRSLNFVDEIIIVDGGSTDKTCLVSEELGAKVFYNSFEGYGQQKNFAASLCRNKWIFSIDADEEVTEDLKKSILALDSKQELSKIFNVNRRTMFCGQWIYHGGWYPDNVARLYNKDFAEWTTPHVHEKIVFKGLLEKQQESALHGHLNHYSFPTVKSQVLTNVKYATLGAGDLINKKGGRPRLYAVLLKPIVKFLECYFIKKGFLDGLAGFIIAINAAYSMFMKYIFAYYDLKGKLEKSD